MLTCTHNKKQLIDILTKHIAERIQQTVFPHTLVLTGSDEVPSLVCNGVVTRKESFRTSHEEADIILLQQCYWLIIEKSHSNVRVISDDVEVFGQLCYFYAVIEEDVMVYMESFVKGRTTIDIGATVRKHPDLIAKILLGHSLSGCDSVCRTVGIGKAKAISAMEKSSLVYLGNLNAPITEIVAEATKFFGFCYSILEGENMSEKRYHAWLRKTSSGKLSSAPKLSSLPPTTEAFTQNVLRAHCQCAIWLSTLSPDPPNIDPPNFGWKRDEDNECLVPVKLPPGIDALPKDVQKLIL